MTKTKTAVAYFEDNKKRFLDKLYELVAIPSVSADPERQHDVLRSAEAVADYMREIGLEHVQLLQVKGGQPAVYGDWLHAKGKPTLLLYAHHDVQPTGEIAKWKTDPFKATEKNGRLYGRGAGDDKGGLMMHLAAIASTLKTEGALPVNIKCLFEGEEEIGSPTLETLLMKYQKKLQADVMVLTDTENYAVGIPGITTQLRGLYSCQVTVSALEKPVHSGGWGGPLPDPIQALAKLLAQLTSEDGRMAIPGIYDDVRKLTPGERKALKALPFDLAAFRKHGGVLEEVPLCKQGDCTPKEMIWHQPQISVNAIQSSSKAHVSNVIMDSAWAQIGIRMVPDMGLAKTKKQLTQFLEKHVPKGFRLTIEEGHAVSWWRTGTEHSAFRAAERALEQGYGVRPVYMGCGGSIGFVEPFAKALQAPALLIGVEDPETAAHSWNESLHLGDWHKGVLSMIALFRELGGMALR